MCTGFEILTIVSTGVGVADSILGGIQENNEAKFQAELAEQRAQREREIAARDAQDFERRERANLARSRALRAASGVEISEGTPLLVDRATNVEIELGRETIKAGGDTRGVRLEQEAQLRRTAGRNRQTAGFFRAGKTLLTGASKLDFG